MIESIVRAWVNVSRSNIQFTYCERIVKFLDLSSSLLAGKKKRGGVLNTSEVHVISVLIVTVIIHNHNPGWLCGPDLYVARTCEHWRSAKCHFVGHILAETNADHLPGSACFQIIRLSSSGSFGKRSNVDVLSRASLLFSLEAAMFSGSCGRGFMLKCFGASMQPCKI